MDKNTHIMEMKKLSKKLYLIIGSVWIQKRNLSRKNVLLFCPLKYQDKQWEFDVKITWKLWSGGHRGRYLSYFKRKITSHPPCFIIQYTSQPPLSRAIGLAIFMSPMSLWGLKVGRDRDVARQNYPGLPSMCQELWFSLALSPGRFPAFGGKRVLHTQSQSVWRGVWFPPCH